MTGEQRPKKVYREEAKDRHTSHWDWDYLPREQLDDAAAQASPKSSRATLGQDAAEDSAEGVGEGRKNWVRRSWHAMVRLLKGGR